MALTFFDLLVGFKGLSKLKKLEILNIDYNGFNKTIVKQLSGLTSLKALSVSNNDIEGFFPFQGIASPFNILGNYSTIIFHFFQLYFNFCIILQNYLFLKTW